MNLDGSPWFTKGQEADYINAFRRVVGIFRRYSDGFKYDWRPGWGLQDLPADLAYPGDDVVDGQWPTQIDNNQFPQSQKLFRKLFRR